MKLLLTLFVLLLGSGCVSGGTGSGGGSRGPRLEHSAGAVVTGDLDRVWRAVTTTFKEIDVMGADIDESTRTATVPYMGATVSMRAERKDAGNTILRVQAVRDGQNVQNIADKVMAAVQRKLF